MTSIHSAKAGGRPATFMSLEQANASLRAGRLALGISGLSYLDFACSTERMKPPKPDTRKPWTPPPQPLARPGEQRPQHLQDEDEADAFSRWLAHVEAGRIGPSSR